MHLLNGSKAAEDGSHRNLMNENDGSNWTTILFSNDDDETVKGDEKGSGKGKDTDSGKGKGTDSGKGKGTHSPEGKKGKKDGKGSKQETGKGGQGKKGDKEEKGGKSGKKGHGKGNPKESKTLSPSQSGAPSSTPVPTSTDFLSESPTRYSTKKHRPSSPPSMASGSNDRPSPSPSKASESEDSPSPSPSKDSETEDRPSHSRAPSVNPERKNSSLAPSPEGPSVSPDPTVSHAPSAIEGPTTIVSSSVPSAGPSAIGPIPGQRDLTPYGIAYSVDVPDIPGAIDFAEVALLTNNYLAAYFEDLFADTYSTRLENFITVFVNGDFLFNQPIKVDYESVAYFNASGTLITPSVDDLDILLRQAFVGLNLDEYLEQLSTLTSNVFSTTTNAEVVNSTSANFAVKQEKEQRQQPASATSTGTDPLIPAFVGMSVGVLFVGALVVSLMRRRKRQSQQQQTIVMKSIIGPRSQSVEGNEDPTLADTSRQQSVYLLDTMEPIPEHDEYGSDSDTPNNGPETSPLFGGQSEFEFDDANTLRDVHF